VKRGSVKHVLYRDDDDTDMSVVVAGHAHVITFLPLSCELSIFVVVTVIF
jgi:hypothetical protein